MNIKERGKRKLIQINTVCNASTGRIMRDIQEKAQRQGYDTLSIVGRRRPFNDLKCVKFGNPVSFWIHVVLNTVFDRQGYGSWFVTKLLVRRLRAESPDIIHLHNLHGYYLNIPVLFRYLREEYEGKLFWTFHDCWPFTGHCAYFTMAGCDKWKKECYHCVNKTKYPISWFLDASAINFRKKRQMFSGLKNLTIIVPSKWMAQRVEESFFKGVKTEIVPNGTDLSIFSYSVSDRILSKYGIPDAKKILLGVANIWDERKGLSDFLQLSEVLPGEYQIVLVGLSRNQVRRLPDNVIGIMRTENREELVTLYSRADIFINPSREESFSLVTVEAFACGTPVIVLDTSAVKDLVDRENGANGIVLHKYDVQDYMEAIREIEMRKPDRKRVAECAERYERNKCAAQVLELYEDAL